MIRTFRPKWHLVLIFLTTAAMFLVWPATVRQDLWRWPSRPDEWLALPPFAVILLITGIFGLYLLYGAVICSATIEVDDEGITRRMLWRRRWLLWRNLARFQTSGMGQGDYVLWDHDGKRMDVDVSVLRNGDELQGELQARTEPLREAMLREWRTSGAEFQPTLPMAPALIPSLALLAALCFFGAFALPQLTVRSAGERASLIVSAVLSGAFGVLLTWLVSESSTRVLRLSDRGICVRSLFGRREIAYADVVSVMSRELQTNDVKQQITTVRSRDNRKLIFNSVYPNYASIVEFLQERTGPSAVTEGANDLKAVTTKQSRQMARFFLFASPLYLCIFLGAPLWLMHRAQERIEGYDRISRHGVPVEATITGKDTSGSKNTEYLLLYRFQARGRTSPIEGASPVDYDLWERTEAGQKMPAIYVPTNPHWCRLRVSISRSLGLFDLRLSWFYFAAGVFASVAYVYMVYRAYAKGAGKWKEPPIPDKTSRLDDVRLKQMRRELKGIGISRIAGMTIGMAGMGTMLLLVLVFAIGSAINPTLRRLGTERRTARSMILLVASPGIAALASLFLVAPLGELYAFLRTKKLQDDLADPRLLPDLIAALQRSTQMEQNLSGSTSLRLLNAATAILADGEAPAVPSGERHFLYKLLEKWQNVEERAPFSLALLQVIPAWNDSAGMAAARTAATTSTVDAVRDAAIHSLENTQK